MSTPDETACLTDPDPPSWARARAWWGKPMLAPRGLMVLVVLWPLAFTTVMWLVWDASTPRPSWTNLLLNLLAIAVPAVVFVSVMAVGAVGISLAFRRWWHGRQIRVLAFGAAVLVSRAEYYMRTGAADPLTAAAYDYSSMVTGDPPNASAWTVGASEWLAAHPGALPVPVILFRRKDTAA